MKKQRKNQKGITLIALVITIIVLLILAGVSISLVVGENGIIKKAQLAKDIYVNSSIKEQEMINSLYDTLTDLENEKVTDETPGDITDGGKQDGTQNKPYYIQSVEDLIKFSLDVTEENEFYIGKFIELNNNLDIKSVNSYIDSDTKIFGDINEDGIEEGLMLELNKENTKGYPILERFSGNFDGKNHTIKGFYIEGNESIEYYGFVKKLEETGCIKNLNLEGNIKYMGEDNDRPTVYVGGIAGRNKGTIENCTAKVEINAILNNPILDGDNKMSLGGITGSNLNKVIGCINEGNITAECNENVQEEISRVIVDIGGIAGYCQSEIYNCINNGNITSHKTNTGINPIKAQYVGGAVGRLNLESITINVVNNGKVYAYGDEKACVGGIIGGVDYNFIETEAMNICNLGEVKAAMTLDNDKSDLEIGGVIGDAYGSKISKCFNIGDVIDVNINNKTELIGGLIGNKHNNTFLNSYYYVENVLYGVEAGYLNSEVTGVTREQNLTVDKIIQYMNQNVEENNSVSQSIILKKWKNSNDKIVFE